MLKSAPFEMRQQSDNLSTVLQKKKIVSKLTHLKQKLHINHIYKFIPHVAGNMEADHKKNYFSVGK